MTRQALLLPGAVLPAPLAYAGLLHALDGDEVFAKDLELYAGPEPPPGYRLDDEIAGVLTLAETLGFDRFHLVGYSAGGAVAAMLAARHPQRLLSLALLEPAWMGNEGQSPEERRIVAEYERMHDLPPREMMEVFVRLQLAPGVSPPPRPDGPPPPWMRQRPGGIRALTDAFRAGEIPASRLRAFRRPVYYALGGLSNPDLYERRAERAAALFPAFSLERFEDCHHFAPPHRMEPERLARSLRVHWDRAAVTDDGP